MASCLPPDRVNRTVESIRRSVRQADRLIEDLLEAARVSCCALRVARSSQAPTDLLLAAADQYRPLLAERSLTLEVEADETLPEVQADRNRVLQVLGNLIGNAMKFTQAGGRITLGARAEEGCVCFSVTDTGQGVAPDQKQHMFDLFWQARPEAAQGAGLGLSIARALIEAQEGRIWAESDEGAGTTILFTLKTANAQGDSLATARI